MQEKNKNRLILSLILNLLIVAMETAALIMSINSHGLGMFEFYTQDSNYLALIACLIMAVAEIIALRSGKALPEWVMALKYIATCCLTLTLIVVLFCLIPAYGADSIVFMLFCGSSLFMHLLCPVVAIVGYIFIEHEPLLSGRHTWLALIPTVIYAIVSIILNVLKIWEGPYPFLYVYKQPVWMSCIWFVVIVGGALLLAYLLRLANNKLAQKRLSGGENA